MSVVAADEVRAFIISELRASFAENNVDVAAVPDDFDLMKMGVIDSIGLINLLGSIDDRFGVEVDYEGLDTDDITVIGPLCRYIEARAQKRSA
jgi:acyl carrier protein